jgi:SNF2 family DNA or RNA helicase
MLRLAEVTSGYAKTDESGIYRFDPNNKLEMLVEEIKEYLDNNPKSKIQIWAHWTENIKQISYRLQQIEKIQCAVFYGGTKDSDRQIAEDEFNTNPECRVFIGSPSAGGVGLNLLGYDKTKPDESQTNCDWVIYYSQNFSTVVRRQSEDRAHRKGTRTNVRITDLIVPGSIDEMIIERVKDKIEAAMTLQDIKSILANALKPAVNGD